MRSASSEIPTILGFDTAILSGSLAICAGAKTLYSKGSDVSRSETLLNQIELGLEKCSLAVSDLDMIAVSVGPGSFTGIRIGIATALGLKRSRSIECLGISLIEAMKMDGKSADRIIVLPVGRRQYLIEDNCDQAHSVDFVGSTKIVDESELIARIERTKDTQYLFPKAEHNKEFFQPFVNIPNVEFCESTPAELICRTAICGRASHDLTPIYVQR
ncbi:MAG: tRNA (adenosine(37)-N6)-threonylcarbamoyltransferase complex dimerization subunit type 1 TsaB [Pyrinomonadaceae bacterium]